MKTTEALELLDQFHAHKPFFQEIGNVIRELDAQNNSLRSQVEGVTVPIRVHQEEMGELRERFQNLGRRFEDLKKLIRGEVLDQIYNQHGQNTELIDRVRGATLETPSDVPFNMSKERCMYLADMEGDDTVAAGCLDSQNVTVEGPAGSATSPKPTNSPL